MPFISIQTKIALANALKKRMEHTSFDKITVKDVVTECGVNRQTFYYHFQDIYELLGWIYKTEAVDTISDCRSYDTWQQGFLKIFHYVEDNKAISLNTFHSIAREHLEGFLQSVVFDLLIDIVNELAQERAIPEADKKFIANFYTYAFIGLLCEWLKTGMKEKPETIIEQLSKLIDGDIARAITKYVKS